MAEAKQAGEEFLRRFAAKNDEPPEDEAGLTHERQANAQPSP